MGTATETLHEAVDAAAAVDLDTLTDSESDTELVALVGPSIAWTPNWPAGRVAGRARAIWQSDGSRAPWARLSRTAGLSPGAAKQILRHGRDVAQMPATAQAWTGGEIGADHVDLLTGAAGNGRGGSCSPATRRCWSGQCMSLTFRQVVKAVRLLVSAR